MEQYIASKNDAEDNGRISRSFMWKKKQIIKLWYNIIPLGGKEGKVNREKD